jgi:hypothetical protein
MKKHGLARSQEILMVKAENQTIENKHLTAVSVSQLEERKKMLKMEV